ncbi:hypothetical protein ACFOW1_13865 [Parasediminibacterium paludis]|jgi:multidrug efflux pump subunit AcrB|uniref:Uncharacterized protein n=1 Tax=Parasediminibacterium paludis TaxID=908966 RepID=A0ABV8PYN7_9BACT
MQQRKGISAIILILIAVAIGSFLKNVKTGLIIGLALGLLLSGLLSTRRK